MVDKIYSITKDAVVELQVKMKEWVRAVMPSKTSDLTNDNSFIAGTIVEISESDVDELDWGGFPPDDVVTILGRQYRTVTVGDQTWLAENLAYDDNSGNGIYTSPKGNVYYTLESAKRVANSIDGWRLPTNADFDKLLRGISTAVRQSEGPDGDIVYEYADANDKIRSAEFYNGLDTLGFGVTAAGRYAKEIWDEDRIYLEDEESYIWGTTAVQYSDSLHYAMETLKNDREYSNVTDVSIELSSDAWEFSVRLVKE